MKKLGLLIATLLLAFSAAYAQNVQVKGVVADAISGEAVSFASVVVKGTLIGTSTDDNGQFSLSVPKASTLVVSFVGYETKEIALGNAVVLDIKLNPSAEGLDDVLVVAYSTTTKASFTGSAKSMKSDDMSSQKTSLVKSFEGKVAGVRVGSATGDPGADQRIQIRGIGSISGSTQPLYVIDGVPIVNDDMTSGLKSQSILSTLNPDDIDNMTILKDAAAASLYGSRAANGVIIITTKQGKAGKTKITYDGEFGFSNIAVPSAVKTMTAEQLKQYWTDGLQGYFEYYGGYSPSEAADAAAAEIRDGWFWNFDNPANTDWSKEVYGTGFNTNHQVGISGGTEKTKFYTSFGYNKVNGTVRGSDFQRYSGRVNLDHNVTDWLKIGVKQMISYSSTSGYRDQSDQSQGFGTTTPLSVLFSSDPTAAVRLQDGTWNPNTAFGKVANPHIMQAKDLNEYAEFDKSNTVRSMSNFDAVLTLPVGFTARTVFGYDYVSNREQEFWAPESVNGQSLGGLGARYFNTNSTLTSSTTLNWAGEFSGHSINALAGYEVENRNLEYAGLSANGYGTWKLPELSNGQPRSASSSVYSAALMSIIANANYNYDNRYYFSASFRRDGSSRLAAENRWSNFWSVSGAWRISGEEFLKGVELFHDLKLRVSYGTNGNLPAGYYPYKGLYSTSSGYGTNPAYVWSQLENKTLGWEKSGSLNVGIDWNLYGRVSITAEYYNKLTTDLLFAMPTSIVTGFSTKQSNIGKLSNTGFEISISSINIRTKDFSWETDFNITFQKNKVVSLPNGEDVQYGDGSMYLLREGESMHTFNLPKAVGVNPETGLMEFWIDPLDESKGKTPYYTKAGWTIVGKAVPDIIGGMTNTLRWKGLDLSFMISFQQGASLFDYPGYFLQYSDGVRIGSFNMMAEVADNYWRKPGDNAKYPRPIYSNPYRGDKFSSREIISTDNIRMRDITLGYTFNTRNTKVIQKCRIYARASNPFLFYNAAGTIDPDVDINGYRQTDTPPVRSFVFGINFEL